MDQKVLRNAHFMGLGFSMNRKVRSNPLEQCSDGCHRELEEGEKVLGRPPWTIRTFGEECEGSRSNQVSRVLVLTFHGFSTR